MSRWIRWEYVAPRVLVMIVAILTLQYGLCLAVRYLVMLGGEAAIGAKVELARARVALVGGQIELHDLRLANPRAPFQNLFQIDHATLDVKASALLHKRTVIHSGRISGLQFATPRETSGALPTNKPATPSALNWLGNQTAESAEAWLEQLAAKFESDLLNQLESVRLTEELLTRWPRQHEVLAARVEQLEERGVDLQATYSDAQDNPLRHVDFLKKLPKKIVALQREFVSLAIEIEELPELVDADRRAIVAARKHDEQLIRQHFRVDTIDSALLTAYFLHGQLNGPLGELIAWVRWAQNAASAEPEPAETGRLGGEDILFAGVTRMPDLLIRSLEVQGTTCIGGRTLAIEGTLQNLSSAPVLQDQPTRVLLAASGATPWRFEATIDRTGGVARDEIRFDCQELPLLAASWGSSDSLCLAAAPSIGAINVCLCVDDRRLSGNIEFSQKQLHLTPAVGDKFQTVPVTAALQESLAGIDSLALRMTVGGTLDEPQCELSSNFGPSVAEAIVRALERAAKQQTTIILAKSQQHVDEQLAGLESQIAERQAALLRPLEGSTGLLRKIVSDCKTSGQLSTERIGRQLPAGSLFR